MVCKHAPGDPYCSSSHRYSYAESTQASPDPRNHKILSVVQEGKHLLMKVMYPNCARCSYEGIKILVYLNVPAVEAVKWRSVDPHFTNKKPVSDEHAPSPSARFPASEDGWKDAIVYARSKN